MENLSKVKLGIFVTVGIALFSILIFYVSVKQLIQPHARLVTIFKESVQGLEKGSQVKYKGVTIGSVSDIFIMTSNEQHLIQVEMKINFDSLHSSDTKQLAKMFGDFIQKERKRGLRCRLEFAGITGQKYIEMDYFDGIPNSPMEELALINSKDRQYYLPSTRSVFKGLISQLTRSLNNIAKIDFHGISKDLHKSIQSADKLINSPEISRIVAELQKSSQNLTAILEKANQAFDAKDIREILSEINDLIKETDSLITIAKKDLKRAQIGKTTESFRNAANAVTTSKEDVTYLLKQIEQTVASLNELINKINDDPSSLIRGKQTSPALKEVQNSN
ncbi:MlaD family protein [Lentisphaerota bacterium WC36G]|nr:MlaD family protein [Lentisphaerae bacterium WC36]